MRFDQQFFRETRMVSRRIKALALGVGVACALSLATASQAQDAGDQTATAASSGTSQQSKVQKKAARKARREQKNADLNKLEKNGYNPAGNQLRYPQNVQNAEKKANAQGAGAMAPASAP
jgi:predicted secreted acid phosphatase